MSWRRSSAAPASQPAALLLTLRDAGGQGGGGAQIRGIPVVGGGGSRGCQQRMHSGATPRFPLLLSSSLPKLPNPTFQPLGCWAG